MTLQQETAAPTPEKARLSPGAPRKGGAFQAVLWTLGGEAATQAFRFLSNLLLTRLLLPEAFGLMALINVFTYGLNMISDLGIRPIIIRHPRGDDAAFLNTVWTVRLVRGAVLATAAAALGWPLALFYEDPRLAWLFPAVSLNLLLEGFQTTKGISRERNLQLGRVTLINLGTSLLGILVMIAWAWKSPTAWALVAGGLAGTVVRVALTWVALPGPNNRLQWDREAWREVSHFGKWVFLSSLVTFLATRFDKLVFAKLIPFSQLGIYSIAIAMSGLAVEVILKLSSSVGLPALSRARERGTELAGVFERVRLPLLLAGGAGVSLLILCGPAIISLLYDNRYQSAGWILQIAAIGAWFQMLEASHGQLLLALGKPKWRAIAFTAQIVALLIVFPLAYDSWGFIGALAAASLIEGVRYAIEAWQVRKAGLTSWGGERLFSGLILVCGLADVAIQHGPWFSGTPLLRALLCLAVFAVVWSIAAAWYWRKRRAAA